MADIQAQDCLCTDEGCKRCTECYCEEVCRTNPENKCLTGCTAGTAECINDVKKHGPYCKVDCSVCSVTWSIEVGVEEEEKDILDATDVCAGEGRFGVPVVMILSSDPGKTNADSIIEEYPADSDTI